MKEYYNFCLSTCSEKRLYKIKRVLQVAREAIGKPLDKLNVDDVVKYLTFINQSDYKPYTKNDHKKIFKRFLKWQYKDLEMIEGFKVKDGFKCVSDRRAFNFKKINENTLLKPEEYEKLIRIANSLKWKALITLMYEGALRPCEVQSLRWDNLNFSESEGVCRISLVSPKTKEHRKILVKDCVIHLKRWKEEYSFPDRKGDDFVFPSQHHQDQPLGNGVITQMFKRLSVKAGIRPIFPYLLRHTRLTELKKLKVHTDIVCKFAGHTPRTNEIYTHMSADDVESEIMALYPTEELTETQKNEFQKELAKQKEIIDNLLREKEQGSIALVAIANRMHELEENLLPLVPTIKQVKSS